MRCVCVLGGVVVATIDGRGPAYFQWNKLLPPENNGVVPG